MMRTNDEHVLSLITSSSVLRDLDFELRDEETRRQYRRARESDFTSEDLPETSMLPDLCSHRDT